MQCQKCAHLNPDNAKTCESCNFDLTYPQAIKPQSKTSKMAIISLVLGISSLFFFVITGIPAIILGNISNLRIKRSKEKIKGRLIAVLSIIISIIFMYIFFSFWRLDAPPILNDYTTADLSSAPADCAPSYELLKKLINQFADPKREIDVFNEFAAAIEKDTGKKITLEIPANFIDQSSEPNMLEIVLSQEDIDTINETIIVIDKGTASEISNILNKNSDIIKEAWLKAEKSRDIIRQLNEFTEIADLTESKVSVKPLKFFNIMKLKNLCLVYSYLINEQKDVENFTSDMIRFDSFIKKLSLNIRSLPGKLVCNECIKTNIQIVNNILNNQSTNRESIVLLSEQFKHLTSKHLSFRNVFISEYLLRKDLVDEVLSQTKNRKASLLKTNSTLRMFWNHWNGLITKLEDTNDTLKESLSVWPVCYTVKEPNPPIKFYGKLPLIYSLYNPVGSNIIQTLSFDTYEELPKQKTQLRILYALLQVVTNKRLGKNADLTAIAYSDEYIIDVENKRIFSPGPDGKNGTNDDIWLPINPEVLGLTN